VPRHVAASVVILAVAAALPLFAAEPVIGGPCEGCELVFAGLPAEIPSRARIAPRGERGDPLVIQGTVRHRDGSPAPGIIVYAYQTDAGGIYPKGSTRHGRLRGWARTDADGRYRFDTIRPGSYPNRQAEQHIHMHVIEPGTATYWIDDLVFDDDPLLSNRARRNRGGSGVARPEKDPQAVWHVRRDITLRLNVGD
jgi:protocatechuate 3,4-dioxygenase, beta subunit